ncbi:MAG: hypothetical protein KJO07_23420, partial [Deltaproteobacteria bacterium]|nr:hypothetical protein [Deltaproteobacteria bacterium]
MVQATCRKCKTILRFDDDDVPPSGKIVKCTTCKSPVTVMPNAAAEMGLPGEDGLGAGGRLPEQPRRKSPLAGVKPPATPSPRRSPLAAAKPTPPRPAGMADLPAPKGPAGHADLPAPKGPAGHADLPAPKGPAGHADLPAPKEP